MLITLTDNTDRPVILSAILKVPEGMTADEALAAADRACDRARADSPEEWNYSDIIARLERLGFVNQEFVQWREV